MIPLRSGMVDLSPHLTWIDSARLGTSTSYGKMPDLSPMWFWCIIRPQMCKITGGLQQSSI